MAAVFEHTVQGSPGQTLPSHSLVKTKRSKLEVHAPAVNQTNLQIDLLLESIESHAIREAVRIVLGDLLRLQDCLRLFESHLRRSDQAHETLALFELVHAEARLVVDDIRSLTLETSGLDKSLLETLDGIAFAIGHDLNRVFDCQLTGLNLETPAELIIGELIHSHGLLTNCLQESIVSLAREFDSTITCAGLFADFKDRMEESLVLCRDLTELIQYVEAWQADHGELPATSVVDRVMKFRRCSMPFLMYRDWKEYERFSAKITLASTDGQTLSPVLHSFGCYLETLLGLVSSRSVFSRVSGQYPSEFECVPLAH